MVHKLIFICIELLVFYKDLHEIEIQTILEFCNKTDLEPNFISLEYQKKYYEENYDYNSNLKAIYKLKRKLKYEEY